jgi:hypothetical protein
VKRQILLLACLFAVAPAWARAACNVPFPNRNQLPVAAVFLELTGLSPCPTPQGRLAVQAFLQLSNTLRNKSAAGSELVIDNERGDAHAVLRYGLSGASDLSLDLAYVRDAKSGLADSLIRNFHDAIGTPQGNRAAREDDLFEYSQVNGVTGRTLRIGEPPAGFAEPVVTYRRRQRPFSLWWWEEVRWGWRLAAKLPLGDDSPAIASGEPDVGGGLMLDTDLHTPWVRVGMYANLGLAYLSPTDAVVFHTRRWVPMGTAGLTAAPTDRLTLVIQAQVAGARYKDPPFAVLKDPQNILLAGAHFRWGESLFSLAFTEDPNTTAEDVGLLFSFTSGAF